MSEQTDPKFLKGEAYSDASDLDTRNTIQQRYGRRQPTWFRWLFDQLRLPGGASILELGCGSGELWLANRDRLSPGWALRLSDLSLGMLQAARRRVLSSQSRLPSPRYSFSIADAQAIPFPARQFDAVLAVGLLDHVPDRVKALNEICRVLRPRGSLYATAGGQTHLQEIESLVRPFLPDADYGGTPERFGLDNGACLLSPWFEAVELHSYEDELVFEQPEPILAYVLSEALVRKNLAGDRRAAFQDYVQRALDARGSLKVTSAKGLFSARLRHKPHGCQG